MKKHILYLALFSLFCTGYSFGQVTGCLVNGDFDQYCNTTVNTTGGCPTFDANCVTNWTRSHGSPQIMTPGPAATDNVAYMWSRYDDGEGIFATYTFQRYHSYSIRIKLNAVAYVGSTYIYAANNMQQGGIFDCGDPVPNVASKSLVAQINEVNMGWKEYTFNFTPTDNDYTQLWIFPYTGSSVMYNLYVDYVFPCIDTCNGTVYYNNGVVPAGRTPAGNIYAGSSAGTGGSGTVSVSSTAATDLIARNEIQLLREFEASVSTGSFSATIAPCDTGGGGAARYAPVAGPDISRLYTRQDSIVMAPHKLALNREAVLSIYPNPVQNKLGINLTAPNEGVVTMSIMNSQGQMLKTTVVNMTGANNTPFQSELDVSGLPAGVYFIKATGQRLSTVARFEKIQ